MVRVNKVDQVEGEDLVDKIAALGILAIFHILCI